MRILIITDRFTPEVSAASTRLHAHARAWAQAGYKVTVLTCAPNFPRGKLFEGYRNRWTQTEEMDGFEVVRVWSYMAPNRGVFRRSLDYLSFIVSATLHFGSFRNVDVILASSPPITVALIGGLLGKILRKPWIFEVRDLWPASIRAVGVSKGPLVSFLEWLELKLYASAAGTIVLTDPFHSDLVSRGVDPAKISVVTNGIDVEKWTTSVSREEARKHLHLPASDFLVGFIGTVGLAQGAGVFVRAAHRLCGVEGVKFLCLGEGADRPVVEELARALGADNIIFRDFVPFSEVPTVLAALDVGTVLLKNDPVFDTVIPSKLFELMAAGLPIAASAGQETQRLIALSGAGICVPPEDDAALADAIRQLHRDQATRQSMGERGGVFVRKNYARSTLAAKALTFIHQVKDLRR